MTGRVQADWTMSARFGAGRILDGVRWAAEAWQIKDDRMMRGSREFAGQLPWLQMVQLS